MRWLSGVELRFRASFAENPCVVEPLIGVVELLEGRFRFAVTIGRAASELICKGEPEHPQCKLMLWFDDEDIATDRLCFFRFAEAAVAFRLCDGLGDACGRNMFQLVCHGVFLYN